MDDLAGDESVDTERVAQVLACHLNTVYRLLESGKLPGYRVGSQWRVRKAALAAFVRQRREQE